MLRLEKNRLIALIRTAVLVPTKGSSRLDVQYGIKSINGSFLSRGCSSISDGKTDGRVSNQETV